MRTNNVFTWCDWTRFELKSSPVSIHPAFNSRGDSTAPHQLALTLAGEMEDCALVEVCQGTTVETLDLRYGHCFQTFKLPFDRFDSARPIELRKRSGSDSLTFFAGGTAPENFCPRVEPFVPGDRRAALGRLDSLGSLQPFGWMEGCVLEGLYDAQQAGWIGEEGLSKHLRFWFASGENLHYMGPTGGMIEDEIFGIEAGLPFAALASVQPDAAALSILRNFVKQHSDADGLVLDRGMDAEGRALDITYISIEGCYTLAPTLARLAKIESVPALAESALIQIRHRIGALLSGGLAAQRRPLEGTPEQHAWARAQAWFLLGTARTLRELGSRHFDSVVIKAFQACAAQVIEHQLPNGLWPVYVNEPHTGIDTSGSAGIAAGLAIGAQLGLLPAECRDAAERALDGLETFIQPDGCIGETSQINRGGDPLQRSGYRVQAAFTLGLYAQLLAALHSGPGNCGTL
jgi:hypothetical protein